MNETEVLREALRELAGDGSGPTIHVGHLARARSHRQRRRAAVGAAVGSALLAGVLAAGVSTIDRNGAVTPSPVSPPTPSASATPSISIYESPSVAPLPSITSVKDITGAVPTIDRYCQGAPTVGTSWHIGTGQPPHITTLTVPNATVGKKYEVYLQSTIPDPTAPWAHWATIRGREPFGLLLDGNDGKLLGTPVSVGTFCFSEVVVVRSPGGGYGYATQPYIIIVRRAP